MTRKNKILLRIYAILSLILAVLSLGVAIILIFNLFNIKDMLTQILAEMGYSTKQANLEYYLTMFGAFTAMGLNLYCGLTVLKFVKMNIMIVGLNRLMLYLGVFQILFLESTVVGIYAIIISFILKKDEEKLYSKNRPFNQPLTDEEQLSQMREAYKKGEVSEEEYKKFMNDTIERIAKVKSQENNKKE